MPRQPRPNPPYFLQPVNATWERLDLTEIQFAKKQADPATKTFGLTQGPAIGENPLSAGASALVDTNCANQPFYKAPGAANFTIIPACLTD